MTSLSRTDALRCRMTSLLLDDDGQRTPAEIVTWFGAMQAQDLASGEWSFGVRMPGATAADIAAATERREIVRTWPMRGTVHFVPPADARWMLEVTGVRALAGAAKRREHLGLTEVHVDRAASLLGDALAGGRRLTRAQCVELLTENGLITASQHGYHLLWYSSQIGVTCIGPQQGKEQTFVRLDEWVPEPRVLDRDEALAELALRFVRSHGPVTVKDLAGWTGLTMVDVRAGVAGAGSAIVPVDVDGAPHLMADGLPDAAADASLSKGAVLLLPGFDEYLLGYKDRSMMVPEEHKDRIIPGGNGVFQPTIVVEGRVVGTWKRTVKKDRVLVAPLLFGQLTKRQWTSLERSAGRYAAYLGLPAAEVVR